MSAAAGSLTDPPVPPIYKVGGDLLYEIFFLNTCKEIEFWEPFGRSNQRRSKHHSPLLDIQRVSQVCRAWREILLSSPSIWARCMEIDEKRDEWHKLMLGRTGELPLSIMVRHRNRLKSPSSNFLEDLLHRNWYRISELFLALDSIVDASYAQIAHTLSRPTDTLKVFVLHSNGGWMSLNFPLFQGHAPQLQCLWLPGVGNGDRIDFKSPAMLTSNMCYLGLDDVHNLSMHDLLAALARMPQLERLKLHMPFLNADDVSEDASLPYIVTPHLKILDILCPCLDIYPLFFDRIVPSDGCQLHMKHTSSRFQASAKTTALVQCMHVVLCRYTLSIFTEHQGQPDFATVGLNLTHSNFSFFCYGDRFRIAWPISHVLAFPQLFSAISTAVHAIAGHLDLKMDSTRDNFLHWYNFDISQNIIQLLKSMHAIHTLQIHDIHFYKLHEEYKSEIVLPSLKKLVLGRNPKVDMIRTAVPFLAQRRNTAPVEVLEIILGNKDTVPWEAIHSLDELIGLKVVWTRKRRHFHYICGGNEPRRGLK